MAKIRTPLPADYTTILRRELVRIDDRIASLYRTKNRAMKELIEATRRELAAIPAQYRDAEVIDAEVVEPYDDPRFCPTESQE